MGGIIASPVQDSKNVELSLFYQGSNFYHSWRIIRLDIAFAGVDKKIDALINEPISKLAEQQLQWRLESQRSLKVFTLPVEIARTIKISSGIMQLQRGVPAPSDSLEKSGKSLLPDVKPGGKYRVIISYDGDDGFDTAFVEKPFKKVKEELVQSQMRCQAKGSLEIQQKLQGHLSKSEPSKVKDPVSKISCSASSYLLMSSIMVSFFGLLYLRSFQD